MKDNETIVAESECNEEWYLPYYTCNSCDEAFMAPEAKYCPYCGKKIVGISTSNGKTKEYTF